ncbi:MAG: prolyl oligopeptidase family serine peptidase [Robiginitomaculum sp.]|nr:prolyl oligopeptidase family serine peptidase [Robiginitomaculum sp.]
MKIYTIMVAMIFGMLSILVPIIAQAAKPNPLNAETKQTPLPIDYFAVGNSMSNVSLSQDGKYLAFMTVPSKGAKPIIEVYETSDFTKKPYRVGGKTMRITGFSWVGDKDMAVFFRQKIRKKVKGFNDGVFGFKIAKLDVKKKKFKAFNEFGLRFAGLLPEKPNKILVSFREGVKDGRDIENKAVRETSYYELDLNSGSKKLVLKGNSKYRNVSFDYLGNPRTASSFDTGSREFITYYRKPGQKSWQVINKRSEDDFETFRFAGFIKDDPSRIYVIAHNGNDKRGLWIFNVDTKKFEELVYRRKDVDVVGVRVHSNQFKHPNEVVGVAYNKDKLHIKYFDSVEAATYKQLQGLIPNAYNSRIINRSRDGNTFVVINSGPRDPGSYYLYNNGKFSLVGKRKGILKAEALADVKYIEYKARDGRNIPGFITVPNGEGPFPLVIMPHGGPFIAETVSFVAWGQLLANNGYMVLQPQYRGSHGHGLDHYKSAFINGGQGGFKMQDDKDDGAKYLISQGLVDPDRVAMFGWSYGGYAALVAAARPNNIYQCVIAGAAVADNLQQVNYYRFRLEGTQKLEQLGMWDDSISPIKTAANVNVPMLIIHGDQDQRVPFKHHKKYTNALDKHNIKYEELVLEGADHFSDTLTYNHKVAFYTKMIDFLKNDCGPGGL